VFQDTRLERLDNISAADWYNLRNSAQRVVLTWTRSTLGVGIEVRKAQAPEGHSGLIRIDHVHQGDHDGIKGLHHVNPLDWQVVAKVLDKLTVEFTSRRPKRSSENALAETKNGAVVRKVFGHAGTPQRDADRFNIFCVQYLNLFLNSHRPCLFATDKADPKEAGHVKRVYLAKNAMTPRDKLASLPGAHDCLLEDRTLEHLRELSMALTDVRAAEELNETPASPLKWVPTSTG
jgi:hypothetical protein